MLHVTSLVGQPATMDPKRLADLRSAAAAFVAKDGDSLVLLDCLECLVLHNGAGRVQRMLADLHDDVTMRGGSIVVFADPRALNPRLVAWLEREFDRLPPLAPDVAAALA